MRYDPPTRPLAVMPDGATLHLVVPVTIQIGAELHSGAETVAVVECHAN